MKGFLMFFWLLIVGGVLLMFVIVIFVVVDIEFEGVKCIFNFKGDVKVEIVVEFNGGKVFFCCENCSGKFVEELEVYVIKVNY